MASLEPLPVDSMDWSTRFKEWSAHARTVADIAQALEQEQGGDLESGLRKSAESFQACVESHARDAQILIPWAHLDPKITLGLAKTLREHAPVGTGIEESLRIVPKLADAPDSFDSILSELSLLRATLEDRLPGNGTRSHKSICSPKR